MTKLYSNGTPVRYMYGIEDTLICVQGIYKRSYENFRTVDFFSYKKHRDPSLDTTATCQAQLKTKWTASKTSTREERRKKLTKRQHEIPTTIAATRSPSKALQQARQCPDAEKWGEARHAELDEVEAMNAIDWTSRVIGTNRNEIIPIKMKYRYEKGTRKWNTKRDAQSAGIVWLPTYISTPTKLPTWTTAHLSAHNLHWRYRVKC